MQYLTPKEFAEAAGISKQAVYKQMKSRLLPYIKIEKGQKKIDIAALTEYYIEAKQLKQPETTGSKPEETESKPEETESKPEETEKQPGKVEKSTERKPFPSAESRIEELESIIKRQAEENKKENEFLKEQIRQKDKTIENLLDNLKTAQQLAAADKKKLLDIEQKQQTTVTPEKETITILSSDANIKAHKEEIKRTPGSIKALIKKFLG